MQAVTETEEVRNPSNLENPNDGLKESSLLFKYITKMKGARRTTPLVAPVPLDVLLSIGGTLLGITVIVLLSNKFDIGVVASFGASAVLVFGAPDAPMAQPRNVILGHTLSAAAAVITVMMFGLTWWSPAVGTALALLIMLLTKTTHPPGGATALFGVMTQVQPGYILTPMLAGTVILVIIGLLINNLSPNRRYPRYWL
ncbi:HPP family protein [Desulfosporosinus youngiae]|uniref:CBS-domain-containing membrane protein n=1 Tax=Desulfosporosinus youngiae DSM 17734 TaxID=768710 RepID=H5XUP5_9FIRM|nr:HPP family protein [Desulfosporosinus youngiae]EHQ89202.1 CBS-domain-containing membrane protein [Desulfosporosinus youngiae DSM 17734]